MTSVVVHQQPRVTTTSPMRVLHVIESWRPVVSGYTTRSWELVSAQAQTAALEPYVLVTSRQHVYGATEVVAPDELRGRVVGIVPSGRERTVRPLRRFYLDQQPLREHLRQFCQHHAIDIVHSHWSSGIGDAAAAVATELGLPLVAEVRFDLAGAMMTETVRRPVPRLERLLRRWFERHLAHADAIVAASYSLATLLCQEFPTLAARVSVVPNGVDTALFHPGPADDSLQRQLGLHGAFVLGSTSNMLRYEGLDLLIRALPDVRKQVPNIHLLLVGNGTQHGALQRLAAELGAPVTFVGRVPLAAVPRYLRLMDLFVVPRRAASITQYASPIKVVEAMACGVPVVGSAVGDVPMLIADGRGACTEPASHAVLVTALVALAHNDAARTAMGRRAQRWAREYVSWADTAAVYQTVYAHVLGQPQRGGSRD